MENNVALELASNTRLEDATEEVKTDQQLQPQTSKVEENDVHSDDKASDDQHDDTDSEGGADAHSQTSTEKYDDHEPWETFQVSVQELCRILWPERQPQDIEVTPMHGGDSNRIVGITLRLPTRATIAPLKFLQRRLIGQRAANIIQRVSSMFWTKLTGKKTAEEKKYILRIPRWSTEEFDYEAGVLAYVPSRISLPAPKVISYDKTLVNPLGRPYMLQERLPGVPLYDLWEELNQRQRLHITGQIATYFKEIFDNPLPCGGKIFTEDRPIQSDSTFILRQFEYTAPHGDAAPKQNLPAIALSPCDMITERLLRWEVVEEMACPAEIYGPSAYVGLLEIVKALNQADDIFSPEQYYLYHADFYARNILARVNDDGYAEVTAILDWDEGYLAPAIVSCTPPSWLWMWDTFADSSNYDTEERTTARASHIQEHANDRDIKARFEEIVGEKFLRFAYAKHAPLARNLCRWANVGIWADHITGEAKATYCAYKKVMDQGIDAVLREGQSLQDKALDAATLVATTFEYEDGVRYGEPVESGDTDAKEDSGDEHSTASGDCSA